MAPSDTALQEREQYDPLQDGGFAAKVLGYHRARDCLEWPEEYGRAFRSNSFTNLGNTEMNRPAATTVDPRADFAPIERGLQAHHDGAPLEANPYEVESDDAYSWQDGWCQAEREAKRRKQRADDFAKAVRKGHFRSAVAAVVGEAPKALALSKELLLEFSRTSPELQSSLLGWCESPPERLPITDQRWLVEALARHEMGHMVTAKALGFTISGVTLILHDRAGDHEGTAMLALDLAGPLFEQPCQVGLAEG